MRLLEIILEAGEPANPGRRGFLKRAAAQILSTQLPAQSLTGLATQLAQKTVDPVAAAWTRLLAAGLAAHTEVYMGLDEYFVDSQGRPLPISLENLPKDDFKEFLDYVSNKGYEHSITFPTLWLREYDKKFMDNSVDITTGVSNKGIKYLRVSEGAVVFEHNGQMHTVYSPDILNYEEMLLPGLEEYPGDLLDFGDQQDVETLVDLVAFGPESVPDSWYEDLMRNLDAGQREDYEDNEIYMAAQDILRQRHRARSRAPGTPTAVRPGSGFVATQILRAVQRVIDEVINDVLDNQEIQSKPNPATDRPQSLPAPAAEPDIIKQVLQAAAEELGRELSDQEKEYVIAKVKNESS
jgi:hypothetical protein